MWSIAKIVSLLVVFGLSFSSGIISCVAVIRLMKKYGFSRQFTRAVSLLNCFSGGVFFATSVLHLLPEAREKMEEALELWEIQTEYPLTELLTGIGFLLILSFENISHVCFSTHVTEKSHKRVKHSKNGKNSKIIYVKVPIDGDEAHISDVDETSNIETGTYQNYSEVWDESEEKTRMKSATYTTTKASNSTNHISKEPKYHEGNSLLKSNGNESNANKNRYQKFVSSETGGNNPHQNSMSKIRGIVLLVALSFHMVFDGLALGLLDEDEAVWTLLLALCVHKIVVFLSIGLEAFGLLKSFCKSVGLLFAFALISPIGIAIGVAVTSDEDKLSEYAASAILQGIATGTFIYVTFFEILHREFDGNTHDLLKVLCTVIGFALVGAVKLLEGVNFN